MSSTPDLTLIESALQKFCGNYSDTLLYLQPNQEQQNEWKTMIRDIYNHLSLISCHDSSLKQKILIPELLVDNFDEEQIWQQVELLNEVLVNNVQAEIDKKLSEKTPSPEKNNDNELDDIEEEEEQEEHELEESAEEDINEEDIPANKPKFDLADMDKFCEEVEKEPEEGAEGSEEEEDAPDIFGDLGEDEDNEDDDVQESKLEQQLKKVKYQNCSDCIIKRSSYFYSIIFICRFKLRFMPTKNTQCSRSHGRCSEKVQHETEKTMLYWRSICSSIMVSDLHLRLPWTLLIKLRD